MFIVSGQWPQTSLPVDRPNADWLERRPLMPIFCIYISFFHICFENNISICCKIIPQQMYEVVHLKDTDEQTD